MDAVSNGQGCSVRLRNLTISALVPGVARSSKASGYVLATAGENDRADAAVRES
jgi:hypothetical protein